MAGFEGSLKANSNRKADKYKPIVNELSSEYKKFKFGNVCLSTLDTLGASCVSFREMLKDLHVRTSIYHVR